MTKLNSTKTVRAARSGGGVSCFWGTFSSAVGAVQHPMSESSKQQQGRTQHKTPPLPDTPLLHPHPHPNGPLLLFPGWWPTLTCCHMESPKKNTTTTTTQRRQEEEEEEEWLRLRAAGDSTETHCVLSVLGPPAGERRDFLLKKKKAKFFFLKKALDSLGRSTTDGGERERPCLTVTLAEQEQQQVAPRRTQRRGCGL